MARGPKNCRVTVRLLAACRYGYLISGKFGSPLWGASCAGAPPRPPRLCTLWRLPDVVATRDWVPHAHHEFLMACFRWLAAGLFMVLKLSVVYERGAIVIVSALALRKNRLLTKSVTAAELTQAGNQCAICHVSKATPLR